MAFQRLEFTKSWENPEDFPTYEQSEAQVRADLQLLHEQTRQGINRLVDALNDPEAAGQLPFSGEGLAADTVEAAILETYAAVKTAAAGQLVDGSVGREKLSEEVLERCYGGRPWVSMDLPEAQLPADGFPVGQLWLRPAFSVTNAAGSSWAAFGCTAAATDRGWLLTGTGESAEAQLSMKMEGLGQAEDRVTVVLEASDADSQLAELTLFLNGQACDLMTEQAFSATLDDSGALQAVIHAVWPAAALAVGSVALARWTVVNTAALERELLPAKPVADWQALICGLTPLQTAKLPRCLYQQVRPGRWEQVAWQVLPVEQGGTGMERLPVGSLLVGGGDRIQTLDTSRTDGLLRLRAGNPVWEPLQTAMAEAGALYSKTGTYVGDGEERTITLPVEPQLLVIWSDGGNAAVLGQNGAYISNTYDDGGYYEGAVELSGPTLRMYNLTASFSPVKVLNGSGVTYRWLAFTEAGA